MDQNFFVKYILITAVNVIFRKQFVSKIGYHDDLCIASVTELHRDNTIRFKQSQ